MKKITFLGVLAVLAFSITPPVFATIVFSESEFQTEVGNVVIEQERFLNNISGAPSITFDSGVTSVALGGNPALFGDNGVIDDTAFGDGDGEFFTGVGGAGSTPNSITWTFANDITGFFGSFESVTFTRMQFLDSLDNVLQTVDFENFFPPNIQGLDGFLGYVNIANPFNQIRFTAIPSVNVEFFSVNSFQFTDGTPLPTAGVPNPATPVLFLLGLGVMLVTRRRQSQALK